MVDRVNTVAAYINADIALPYSVADFISLLCLSAWPLELAQVHTVLF